MIKNTTETPQRAMVFLDVAEDEDELFIDWLFNRRVDDECRLQESVRAAEQFYLGGKVA